MYSPSYRYSDRLINKNKTNKNITNHTKINIY